MTFAPPAAHPVRSALVRFGVGAVVVLVSVVASAVLVADRIATREALELAERDARSLAERYVLPLGVDVLDPGDDRRSLDEAFAASVEEGVLLRVKIWADGGSGRGTIVYSDNRLYQGADVGLGDDYALFASGGAIARPVGDDASAPPGSAYEVNAGFTDARGTPFLFEAYLPTPDLAASSADLLRQWLPLVVGSLLLFALATAPLAVQLARRAASAEAERSGVVRRALAEALRDRRGLAQRLHDGPVQDLSGVALVIDSVDRRALSTSDAGLLDRAAAIVRAGVGELRAVGDDLFPDALSADSLEAAVEELRRSTDAGGVTVTVEVGEGLGLDPDGTFLVYRLVREGLRNVVRHADATSARVVVRREGDAVVVEIGDDGRGPGGTRTRGLGLRLLGHEVRERGGSLELRPTRPGSLLAASLPVVV